MPRKTNETSAIEDGEVYMITTRISEYRSNLSRFHGQILQDHEPMRVTGASRGDLIVLPAEDYERLQESISILKDRATMNSLLQGRNEFPPESDEVKGIEEAFSDVLDSENK
jgi:antitoxin YefM